MGGPKKMAPYLVFANDKRETAKELLIGEGNEKPTMGEIAKRVGVLWNQLDDAAKQVRASSRPRPAVHVAPPSRRSRRSRAPLSPFRGGARGPIARGSRIAV